MWSKPEISYRDIPVEIRAIVGPDQSVPGYKAFERFLKKSSFKIVKLLKKPLLSEINRQKRLNLVENFADKDPEYWDYFIWSDLVQSLKIYFTGQIRTLPVEICP